MCTCSPTFFDNLRGTHFDQSIVRKISTVVLSFLVPTDAANGSTHDGEDKHDDANNTHSSTTATGNTVHISIFIIFIVLNIFFGSCQIFAVVTFLGRAQCRQCVDSRVKRKCTRNSIGDFGTKGVHDLIVAMNVLFGHRCFFAGFGHVLNKRRIFCHERHRRCGSGVLGHARA